MKQFAALVYTLGTSTKTNEKLQALQDYFNSAPPKDMVWVIAVFSGRRPKRIVNSTFLKALCMEVNNIPSWLFDECYHTVGDLGETIALLLPEPDAIYESEKTLSYYLEHFTSILKEPDAVKRDFILQSWQQMDRNEKFVFNKLITGGFRIGVSQTIMVKALAKTKNISPSVIAHRISGNWNPATTRAEDLLSESSTTIDHSKPYPFYLSYAVEDEPAALGDINEWTAEWKWDGIRGQIIKRNNELFVWSRGEELMTEKFPEYYEFANALSNGLVLDGEIICLDATASPQIKPLPFSSLQTRIGRKTITKKQLTEAPVGFITYDILEYDGKDIRDMPFIERRALLEKIINKISHPLLRISPTLQATDWQQLHISRAGSRENSSEGLMLKRNNSAY